MNRSPDPHAALRFTLLAAMGLASACRGPADKDDLTADIPTTTGPVDTSDTDTDTPVPTDLCESPTTITDPNTGADSGFVLCADGTINRATPVATVPAYSVSACRGDEEYLYCTTDADCTDGLYGFCGHTDLVPSDEASCGCSYSCTTDAECGDGFACVPQQVGPRVYATQCVPADCISDDDCASDECGLSAYNDGCSTTVRLQCRDDTVDECRADADCTDQCAVSDDTTRFECRMTNCDIGRPPVDPVTGAFALSTPEARTDWRAPLPPIDGPHDATQRAALAAHWTTIARLEHASVASFARFTLDLMALGAPPHLLTAAHAAAADEVDHAARAFAIASALGAPVGPGPLTVPHRPTTLEDTLLALIREACVGETCGVVEARAAAEQCTDPTIRATLLRVAEDESRHAALAWRTLRWLLSQASPALANKASQVFEDTIQRASTNLDVGPTGLSQWGVLGPADRRVARLQAIEQVVRPCMEAALQALRDATAHT